MKTASNQLLQKIKGPNYVGLIALMVIAVSFGLVAVQTFAADSTARYRITSDTYVSASTPSRSHDGLNILRIDSSPERYTYMQVRVPDDPRKIVKAQLRVRSVTGSRNGYELYGVSNEWTARALRFANRPPFGEKLGQSGRFGNNDWTSVDVTKYVTAAGTYSFGLKAVNDRQVTFSSSETRRGPVLVVEYAGVSTPTPTVKPSATPTATATATPTVTATATPRPTATASTTPRPTVTATATPSGNGTLYLSPASTTAASGGQVTLQIRENSGTTAVNAVQANLAFDPAKLQYVSVNETGSSFGLVAFTEPSTGLVKITRAVSGGSPAVTGDKLVATVTFKVTATGTVTFASGSAVSSTAGVDIAGTKTGATVTASGTVTPTVTATPTRTPTPTATATATPTIVPTATPVPGTGSIYLSPASASAASGSNVTFSVRENSGTTAVNAVQANLAYDATKLDYVGVDDAGADFGLVAVTTPTAGLVKITRGVNGGSPALTGDKLVTKVIFKVKATSGSVAVSFATGTAVVSVAGADTLKTNTGATITVSGSTPTPTPTPAPDSQVPTAPTGVTAIISSSSTVFLQWNAATDNVGVVKYQVLRDGVVIAVINAPTLSHNDTTVLPGTTYSYRVAAVDAANLVSPLSAAVSITTPQAPTIDKTPPSTPTNVTATAPLSTQVNVKWSASTDNVGVAGYHVYRNGILFANTIATVLSFGDGSVSAGKTYTYTVSAYDANANESTQSAAVSVTTPAASTPTPTTTSTTTNTPSSTPTTSAAPGAGSIYLSPSTTSGKSGTEVTFEIRENSGSTQVNAVQANLSFDATKLKYVKVDETGSDFGLAAMTTPGTGTINITRATPGGSPAVTGDKLVTKVTFQILGTSGSAAVSFAGGTAVVSLAGTDIVQQKPGATVQITP